jgi:hypothetical protein
MYDMRRAEGFLDRLLYMWRRGAFTKAFAINDTRLRPPQIQNLDFTFYLPPNYMPTIFRVLI